MLKMEFSQILFSILSFTTWMNLVQAMTGPVNACPCVFVSETQVHHSKIERHVIQMEGICTIEAIAFWLTNGKLICSKPDNKWAINVLKKRQQKTTVKPSSKTPASPTSILSTPTSAPETEPSSTPTDALLVTATELSGQTSFPGSEPTSTPKTTAPRSQTPSTPTSALSSTRVRLSSSSSSSSSSFPGSEPTSTPKTTATRSQPPSTTTSTESSTIVTLSSSSSSFPESEPTSTSAPSTTLTPILPSTSRPNNLATGPSTRTVSHRIRATFMARRKAFTRRRFTTRRRPKKNLKAWQRKCSKKSL